MEQITGRARKGAGLISATIFGAIFFACGLVMLLVVVPQQNIEWREIDRLPEITATELAAAQPGDFAVFTGVLEGNEPMDYDLVAYKIDRWSVSPPTEQGQVDTGTWIHESVKVPALTVVFDGQSFSMVQNYEAVLSGALHENFHDGDPNGRNARYGDISLADGTLNTAGFKNGDTVTVYAFIVPSGEISPHRLFAGTREELVIDIKEGASMLTITSYIFLAIGPLLVALNLLGLTGGGKTRTIRIGS